MFENKFPSSFPNIWNLYKIILENLLVQSGFGIVADSESFKHKAVEIPARKVVSLCSSKK